MKPVYSFKNGSTIEPSHFEGIFKIIEQLSARERLEKNGWTIDDGQITEDAEFEIIEPKMITDGTASDTDRTRSPEKGEGT